MLPAKAAGDIATDADRELRAAVLFAELLRDSGGLSRLKAVDDVLAFLVGTGDNLTPAALLDLMGRANVGGVADVADAAAVGQLRNRIEAGGHSAQMIRSQVLIPDDPHRMSEPPGLFQVFGQRFVIDSFFLSQLVYDSIVYRGEKEERLMPRGLDTAAALGNPTAVQLLEPDLRDWNYAGNLEACREYAATKPAAFWGETLYNRWLDALRTLHAPPAEGHFPEVMRSEPWRRKQLQTQLASWAELRHDTILYAKQSYTGGVACEYPAGFVERAVPRVLRQGAGVRRRSRPEVPRNIHRRNAVPRSIHQLLRQHGQHRGQTRNPVPQGTERRAFRRARDRVPEGDHSSRSRLRRAAVVYRVVLPPLLLRTRQTDRIPPGDRGRPHRPELTGLPASRHGVGQPAGRRGGQRPGSHGVRRPGVLVLRIPPPRPRPPHGSDVAADVGVRQSPAAAGLDRTVPGPRPEKVTGTITAS